MAQLVLITVLSLWMCLLQSTWSYQQVIVVGPKSQQSTIIITGHQNEYRVYKRPTLLSYSTHYIRHVSSLSILSSKSLSSSSSDSSMTIKLNNDDNNVELDEDRVMTVTTALEKETTTTATKFYNGMDGVRIFGRLAEKYIALDSSGGQCCYSGCSNCEYRLPGGGYIMADQSSSRPKWIPSYVQRNTNNKEHITKWSSTFFPTTTTTTTQPGTQKTQSITKSEFVSNLQQMEFTPPLGGPYISASNALMEQSTLELAEHIFDTISKGTGSITPLRFSLRLKQLSNGEEGMTWQTFTTAFNIQ